MVHDQHFRKTAALFGDAVNRPGRYDGDDHKVTVEFPYKAGVRIAEK